MIYKICTLCKIDTPLEDFEKDKRTKSGKGCWCNSCRRLRNRLSARKYKKSRSEYNKAWYLKNKVRKNKATRENYDKEIHRVRMLKWRKNNPEKAKAIKHRRRMRKISNGRNDLTSVQIKNIFSKTKSCSYCGLDRKLTIDHIIPISKGGENTVDNISACCKSCNSSKGTKTLLDFMTILGRRNITWVQ